MMNKVQPKDQAGVWEPTRYQNLFRYVPSGTIFARLKIRGKQVRKSLKTSHLELAKNKLGELERNERAISEERRRGKMLFGEALDEFTKSRKCDPTLKPSTKAYDLQRMKALYASWPGLESMDIRRIGKEHCEEWAEEFAINYSPSAYNHSLGMLRHVFETAIDRGVRFDNPARGLKRLAERPKKLTLPSTVQFTAFLAAIEDGGSGKSQPCADLVRFLAYSGLRKMEAA